MKLGIAQINCILGDLPGNTAKILQASEKAKHFGAKLVITPELSLCGYPPEDLLLRDGFIQACGESLDNLSRKVSGISIVVGHPVENGGKLFNAASLLQDGKIVCTYFKNALPNYSVFDEERYFERGSVPCFFELEGIRFALNICEDIWEPNVADMAAKSGAQVLLVLNASPYAIEKRDSRYQIARKRIIESGMSVVYVNMVGGQDELIFDGGSFAMDNKGNLTSQSAHFEESITILDIKDDLSPVGDIFPATSKESEVYSALCLGVRDYITKNGFPGVLLGLSGGIDSALTLAIATDALGANKVHAVMMPSPYTAKISVDDSREMVRILGVRYDELPIGTLFSGYLELLENTFVGYPQDVTEENIQARIRGNLLMALSNKFGSLVLTTGNKSEMTVGYATLYGDMAGGFAVLKDVSKTLVYRLARFRNTLGQVIPERIITRPPSAELRPGQTDQDSLPPYDVLDAIMANYVEKNLSIQQIIQSGYAEAEVRKIVRLIRINEYKRRQSAVGIRITERSYGKDWRYPITVRYQDDF